MIKDSFYIRDRYFVEVRETSTDNLLFTFTKLTKLEAMAFVYYLETFSSFANAKYNIKIGEKIDESK